MARVYGKLLTSIWTDQEFASLSAATQRLYMLLLASPKMSSAGVLPLQVARWSKTARDSSLEGSERALSELEARGYLVVDRESDEVWIRSFIKHDKGYANGNLAKGIVSAIENGIESVDISRLAAGEMMKCLQEGPSKDVTNALMDALGKALAKAIPETSPPTPSTEPSPAAAAEPLPVSGLRKATLFAAAEEVLTRQNPTDVTNRTGLTLSIAERLRTEHPDVDALIKEHGSEGAALIIAERDQPIAEQPAQDTEAITYAARQFGASVKLQHLEQAPPDLLAEYRESFLAELAEQPATYADAALAAYDAFTLPVRLHAV